MKCTLRDWFLSELFLSHTLSWTKLLSLRRDLGYFPCPSCFSQWLRISVVTLTGPSFTAGLSETDVNQWLHGFIMLTFNWFVWDSPLACRVFISHWKMRFIAFIAWFFFLTPHMQCDYAFISLNSNLLHLLSIFMSSSEEYYGLTWYAFVFKIFNLFPFCLKSLSKRRCGFVLIAF